MSGQCAAEGCDRPVTARRLCSAHYQRLRNTGSLGDGPIRTQGALPTEARFWNLVEVREPDDCWLWKGHRQQGYGYGYFWSLEDRMSVRAHRYSARLAGMEIEGLVVRHKCDNPPCVNPRHLEPGTDADNAADCVARGRQGQGTRNAQAKLTEAAVLEIRTRRAQGETTTALAKEFGVSQSGISRITTGNRWRHLPSPHREKAKR